MTKRPNLSSQWRKGEVPALLALLASFLVCFWPWFRHLTSQVFLSLDMTFAYYPLYHWVHSHLAEGKLPLISDLAYHGAPVAAVVMIGILSPALWLFHLVRDFDLAFNLLTLAPQAFYLFGSYVLGRRLGLSSTASLFLSFLWTYNGHQMAQLDHLNVAWAHAFFPWAVAALVEYRERGRIVWLLTAGVLYGLNLLSGHPQVVLLEGLFFLAWVLLAGSGKGWARAKTLSGLFLTALLTATPQVLFTLECRVGQGFPTWTEVDRFFHSWTPLNFLTLLFPWFFGKEQYDRTGGDYWWQYQFVEMQVAFGSVGLFFMLLFLLRKHPLRRFVGWTAGFAVLMAMGKFFPLYPLVSKLPLFSLFRDPARFWFLATWALGIGAAFAWDAWFKDKTPWPLGRKLAWGLGAFALGTLVLGWAALSFGRPLLEGAATWLTKTFLLGDGLHTQPLDHYLSRLGEKLSALAFDLDHRGPWVFLPLGFLAGLLACVLSRDRWTIPFQKAFLLVLLFADLMAFRMPLGGSFLDPSTLPQPSYPPAQNRSLVLLSRDVSPSPKQYAEMGFPNWNFVQTRPNLAFVGAPHLPNYDKLLAGLGWFSWVYKDRDPKGFEKEVEMLRWLGIDQIVSDSPLSLPADFEPVQKHYPFVHRLKGVKPRVSIALARGKLLVTEPKGPSPSVLGWGETSVSISVEGSSSLGPSSMDYLGVQKTLLPGWKAGLNGVPTTPSSDSYGLHMAFILQPGKNLLELTFDPTGLRLGFFLFFLLCGLLACLSLRSRLA